MDEASAHTTVHEGAVYIHQGESFIVHTLDLDDSVALVEAADPDYSTTARDVTDIGIVERLRSVSWGEATLCFGTVEVTRQVVAYQMRRLQTGEMLGEKPLDLPPRTLRTRAVWWTLSEDQVSRLDDLDLAGAAHAAEHARSACSLFATCDRWDIGGVSTAVHPDTGLLTVFVYDGHEGGAGFAERGYADAASWLRATRDAIASCECDSGCPSCIQSPKCGNGNDPLDKRGALDLLAVLLDGAPDSVRRWGPCAARRRAAGRPCPGAPGPGPAGACAAPSPASAATPRARPADPSVPAACSSRAGSPASRPSRPP